MIRDDIMAVKKEINEFQLNLSFDKNCSWVVLSWTDIGKSKFLILSFPSIKNNQGMTGY